MEDQFKAASIRNSKLKAELETAKKEGAAAARKEATALVAAERQRLKEQVPLGFDQLQYT